MLFLVLPYKGIFIHQEWKDHWNIIIFVVKDQISDSPGKNPADRENFISYVFDAWQNRFCTLHLTITLCVRSCLRCDVTLVKSMIWGVVVIVHVHGGNRRSDALYPQTLPSTLSHWWWPTTLVFKLSTPPTVNHQHSYASLATTQSKVSVFFIRFL